MATQDQILRRIREMIGPVRTAQRSLNGTLPRNALNALYSSESPVKTRRSRKSYGGGSRAKVANLFPMEAPMNRPHSERFGTPKQFTKKAPRQNVNAAYRNKIQNVLPTEESLTEGVIAANNAVRSRLRKMYPMRTNLYGGRRTKRTRRNRKITRK